MKIPNWENSLEKSLPNSLRKTGYVQRAHRMLTVKEEDTMGQDIVEERLANCNAEQEHPTLWCFVANPVYLPLLTKPPIDMA